MNVIEYQNNIIRQVLLISEKNKLNKINQLIKKMRVIPFAANKSAGEKDIMEFETFEKWDAYLQSKDIKTLMNFYPNGI